MPDVVPGAVGAKLDQASLRQVGADRYVRACLTSIVSRTGAFDQEDAYRERLPVERLQHDLVRDSLRVRVMVRVRVRARVRVRVRVRVRPAGKDRGAHLPMPLPLTWP